uniref:DNA-binding protein n=1 Tax=Heterorhabditis bacteriophora TaxID=37862 RepID=A0A1I7WBG2_HETBA
MRATGYEWFLKYKYNSENFSDLSK